MRLLIASAVALGDRRPYGMISWLANCLDTSRQTVYTIGAAWSKPPGMMPDLARTPQPPDANRLPGQALTLLVEGAVDLRPALRCLEALLGHERSIGWLSELVDEAGTRAGVVLGSADWSAAGRLILSRDELYMSDLAWLLTVDTKSHAIVSGHVENEVDAETWALSLALDADKIGGGIEALAEDGAKCYPLSVRLVESLLNQPFRPDIHKDHWHLLRQARRTLKDADRIALKHLETAERKASQVRPGLLKIRDFAGWEEAHARAERSIATADTVRAVVQLLPEVLGLVDWRTGQILDRSTAEWYLTAIVADLRHTGSDLAEALAGSIERQIKQLVGFHDRLALHLKAWRRAAADHFTDPQLVAFFESAVARAWRLERAVTNGQRQLRDRAQRAAVYVQALCQADADAQHLADCLHSLLDGTVRTSAASENVNSILRAYLWGRRHFRDRRTAQNWLNLLVLWYNLHVFQRGKRAGKSPFQLAGVTVYGPDGQPTSNWLTALGYAA